MAYHQVHDVDSREAATSQAFQRKLAEKDEVISALQIAARQGRQTGAAQRAHKTSSQARQRMMADQRAVLGKITD